MKLMTLPIPVKSAGHSEAARPGSFIAYMVKGERLMRLERYGEAVGMYEQARELAPFNPIIREKLKLLKEMTQL